MSTQKKSRYMFVPAYSYSSADGKRRRVRVVQSSGLWCINTALPLNGEGYNVTHRPTRLAAISGVPLSMARRALKDFVALKGDWSFTKPEDMTPKQLAAGRRVKQRWIRVADRARD